MVPYFGFFIQIFLVYKFVMYFIHATDLAYRTLLDLKKNY